MVKLIIFFLIILTNTYAKDNELKLKLNGLKKQTVKIHNDILINNKELQKIKIDIDRNKQKTIIFNPILYFWEYESTDDLFKFTLCMG